MIFPHLSSSIGTLLKYANEPGGRNTAVKWGVAGALCTRDRTMPLNCPDLVSEESRADVTPGEDGLKVAVAPCRNEGVCAPHHDGRAGFVWGWPRYSLDSPLSRSTEGAAVYGANFRHRSIFVRKFQNGIPHFVPNTLICHRVSLHHRVCFQ